MNKYIDNIKLITIIVPFYKICNFSLFVLFCLMYSYFRTQYRIIIFRFLHFLFLYFYV